LIVKHTASFAVKFWSETAGDANGVVGWKIFKFIIFSRGADWAMTLPKI
jgi:hypothetical protein